MKNKIQIIITVLILCAVIFLGGDLSAADINTLKINLDVKNMSILDVLRLLAEQGQINIVASRNVQGRVTAKLTDITVAQALDRE
jgi:type II secretory pathway component HofQ